MPGVNLLLFKINLYVLGKYNGGTNITFTVHFTFTLLCD